MPMVTFLVPSPNLIPINRGWKPLQHLVGTAYAIQSKMPMVTFLVPSPILIPIIFCQITTILTKSDRHCL